MSGNHRSIDPAELDHQQRYHLMVSCVVPRPVAWTSTISLQGITNLAPFSFFGGISSDPPTVMLSVGRRSDGSHKDTSCNLLEPSEAVVHICPRADAPTMVATSEGLPAQTSEIDHLGLSTISSDLIAPVRLIDAAIAMETRRIHHQEVGNGPIDLFLLEVVRFHLREDLLVDGLPDAALLQAVGRLGGSLYCDTAAPFAIDRPA